ncbi:MAG: hypothetical protein ACP5RZ_05900 [Thermoplasmata archaeon]
MRKIENKYRYVKILKDEFLKTTVNRIMGIKKAYIIDVYSRIRDGMIIFLSFFPESCSNL